MASFRLASGAFVALLLALPLASAAPAEGWLEVEAPLAAGPSSFTAPSADLLWRASEPPALVLEAERLRVERFGNNETRIPGARVGTTDVREQAEHRASRLVLQPGEGDQVVVVRGVGAVEVSTAALELRPALLVELARPDEVSGWGFCRTERCASASNVYEAATAASEGTIQGKVTLFLHGPTALVTGSGDPVAYRSGRATSQTAAVSSTEDTWVIVTAESATLTLQAPGPARWFSGAPRIETDSAAAGVSTGAITVGAQTHRADDDRVSITGRLVLEPAPVEGAARPRTPDPAIYGDAFAVAVSGDVATINLRAVPVFADSPGEAAGLLALAGASAAALAWYWPHVSFHATSALLPFYTRLKRPDILDNDVRNGIYAIIRENPGISARAVQRQSALSWGTVVYHLRQLERHHLVVSRSLGRTRNYYENHGKYKGMETQLACLQSPRASALARLVLQEPGLTQETLAQMSGFPQPTTSYYVRKLKQARLVEEQRVGRYAHYLPGQDLKRFLELAEAAGAAAPPSAAPS